MAQLIQTPVVMTGEAWADYGLIDSGDGRKLEAYGPYRFIRPEPQAMWRPRLTEWQADGEFIPASDEDGGGSCLHQFEGDIISNAVAQDHWHRHLLTEFSQIERFDALWS